jgi:hypothetical protein
LDSLDMAGDEFDDSNYRNALCESDSVDSAFAASVDEEPNKAPPDQP